MKKLPGLLLLLCLVFASCSKKHHPSRTGSPRERNDSRNAPEPPVSGNYPPAPPPAPSPLIVIDESGRVITSRDRLPSSVAAKVDYGKISRSYTPAQRQNLIYRFKLVPPRVLYVPEQLWSKSAKGTYIVYKKKFYYWKKEDGLFHIDETYYL